MNNIVDEIIEIVEQQIEDNKLIVENYSKIESILDKITKSNWEQIFDSIVYNFELAVEVEQKLSPKTRLLQKTARSLKPQDLAKFDKLNNTLQPIVEERTRLEKVIGKSFLDRGFLSKERYNQYYS